MNRGRLFQTCIKLYGERPDVDWNDVIDEYEVFLRAKIAKQDVNHVYFGPSPLVDDVWHAHILDTKHYQETMKSLKSDFLHHFPAETDTVRNQFHRARRYYDMYHMLPQTSKDKTHIWPKPIAYVLLSGNTRPGEILLEWQGEKTTVGKAKAEIIHHVPQCDPLYHDIRFNVRGDNDAFLNPFTLITWTIEQKLNQPVSPKYKTRSQKKRAREEKIQLFLKTMDGSTMTLNVNTRKHTIGDMKRMYCEKTPGLGHSDHLRFVYAGKQFDDNTSVCVFPQEATIHVVSRIRGC